MKGPPDAPTGVVARAKGPTGATVSFNAPASNGERITEYRIYSGGRQVASCTETVCEVNGLTTWPQLHLHREGSERLRRV